MNVPLPGNEKRRLEFLREHEILDTPPDAEFDTLTHLAAQICRVPIALISLTDENRQWFKASVGTTLTETPREGAFCAHAILKPELMIVADAAADPRFAENPMVLGESRVRYYAGMPLLTSDGLALGTLCVLDRQPRKLLEDQKRALKLIAEIVLLRLAAYRQLRQASRSAQQTAQLARTVAELETEVHRRRRAEEAIRRYADIVQNIQVGILVWQLEEQEEIPTLRLVSANPAASRTTGLPVESLIGKTMLEILPRLADTEVPARFAEVVRTGTFAQLGSLTYEDERIPRRDFEVRAFPLPGQCVGVVLENVTDQRIAEQAQIENQARKAAILDSAPDAIVTIDHEGKVFEWNAAAERMIGHRRSHVLGRELAELVFNPVSAQKFKEALDVCVRSGDGALLGRRVEMTGKRSDGAEFPMELSVTRVPRTGTPIFTGFLRDITERKRFEEALRASQALYSSLVESLPQNVFRKDVQGRFTFANSRLCQTLNRRLEEIIGRTNEELFPDDIAARFREEDRRVTTSGETIESVEAVSLPVLGPRHIQLVRSPIHNAAGSIVGLQGMFWDITERVQLEEHLRQAQKMETVGQLAGGVAHDFNNLLTVIQGHASILLSSAKLQPSQIASLQQIATASERAADLTRQLLTFSRKQMLQPELLDVPALVRRLEDLLRRTVGESITFHFHGEAGLPPVRADPLMLEQVLLNLAINSRDAMPHGGQFLISTTLNDVDEAGAAGNADATPGRYVVITVTDTGCGIDPEDLPRIFEPFFTTKEVGKGTGLGLATVYGIVKQHRGWITTRSEPGHGTVFQVFLPTVTEDLPARGEKGTTPPASGGNETVLVVEDEGAVRDLVRSILELNGYTVLEAPSGRSALTVWEKHRNQIDLLLTDMIMPEGLNGRDLALRLQAEEPELRVMYTSGFGTEVVGVDFLLEEGVNFLQKPYNPRRLAEAVRACLDAPKTP